MVEKLIKFKEGLLTGFKKDSDYRRDDDYYDEYDDAEYDEPEDEKEVYIPESGKRDRRSLGYTRALHSDTHVNMQVIISYPQTVEEAGSICDCVKSGKAVIVNLEGVNHETAQRIVDFLGGVAYALDGDVQSITNKVLIVVPDSVDVSGQFKEELKASGILFSFKSSR